MRVALAPSFGPIKAPGTALAGPALLHPAGARVALGWAPDSLAEPIVPSAASLFGPRGVCLHGDGLWVCDTGHHRLLGWRLVPDRDNQPADILVGQPDFAREGRNAGGPPGGATLNVPTGVAAWGRGLAVADAWNHRVLLWREPPASGQPADIVLGQSGPHGMLANRGADRPDAATLHWPYGVAAIGDRRLAVADTGNRRVLIWNDPVVSGQPADLVLGQRDMATRDENAGGATTALGMRWPHGIAVWRGGLAVADAGDNRIMLWDHLPARSGLPCDHVLGQSDTVSCDHNRGAYYPTAAALSMPYAVSTAGDRLLVADTSNSRLLAFDQPETGAVARWLTGQRDFASKGDNGWGFPRRDSLCWPYGLSIAGRLAAIADSGNNRVLLWDLAEDIA